MNIKRQYILPNCNLILEGLEDSDAENVDILNGQSPMSILINAECHFLASNQTISGGSVFLTNLSRAVSNYAQSFLSGLSQPETKTTEYPQVSIYKTDSHHRLILEPESEPQSGKTEIDLTTIELFDLVDAIDRFHADRNTLPAMTTLELNPVSKRYRQPEQPLAERLTPVGIGFASLAIAAGAFFMIPIPETPVIETNSTEDTTETSPTNTENSVPDPETTPSEPLESQPVKPENSSQ